MRRNGLILSLAALLAWTLAPAPASGLDWQWPDDSGFEPPPWLAAPVPEDEPFFDTTDWPPWAQQAWEKTSETVHNRLRVGFRYRRIRFTDNKRTLSNSFLGSITEIEDLQDVDLSTWLAVEWLPNPYFVIRFNMEQIRGRTRTDTWDNHTDGDLDLKGPQLSLLLRLPNKTRFTPTAGIGYAWLSATFEHNPVWYNGFGGTNKDADYQAWRDAGSPAWPNRGYRREIIPEDTRALILMGGVEIHITPRFDINLFVQNMEVSEVDITYNLSYGGNVFQSQKARFPMSNLGYGFGLRWTF